MSFVQVTVDRSSPDLKGDGWVDGADLALVVVAWGECA
jgi:hypothetical protein